MENMSKNLQMKLFELFGNPDGQSRDSYRVMSNGEKEIFTGSAQSYLLELLYSSSIDSRAFETIMEVSGGFHRFYKEKIEIENLKKIVESVVFAIGENESGANISIMDKIYPDVEEAN